jgi:hypothetical protein
MNELPYYELVIISRDFMGHDYGETTTFVNEDRIPRMLDLARFVSKKGDAWQLIRCMVNERVVIAQSRNRQWLISMEEAIKERYTPMQLREIETAWELIYARDDEDN